MKLKTETVNLCKVQSVENLNSIHSFYTRILKKIVQNFYFTATFFLFALVCFSLVIWFQIFFFYFLHY